MSFWVPRLASLGFGFWFVAGVAVLCGWLSARAILRPARTDTADGVVADVALIRTIVGFVFVLALSWSYRSIEDTFDNSLGNFNITIIVAASLALLSMLVISVTITDTDRDRFREQAWSVVRRILGASLGFIGLLAVGFLSDATNELTPRWIVLALFAAFLGCIAFYVASCWYIGRYWFGLKDTHPLLAPFVAAVTVCVITGMELRYDGPGSIPIRSWLLINVAAVTTTLAMCLWESLEYVNERRDGQSRWPKTIAATVAATALATGAVLVANGSAQRLLCDGKPPPANCKESADDRPSDVKPSAMRFELRAPGGIDLNAARPLLTNDATFADVIYDGTDFGDNTLRTNGRFAIAEWTLTGAPDRDRCDRVLATGWVRESRFRPANEMVLCIETTGGQLASVVISQAREDWIAAEATVWW
jgi:hypothetical protein